MWEVVRLFCLPKVRGDNPPMRENQGVVPSSGQTGQHSSLGITGLGQSVVSSQITSSHITVPLSHTQIWHGSGFQTSLSL